MEFDDIDYAALADKFQQFYDAYNATVDALKSGDTNQLLVGDGATNPPVFKSMWTDWSTVSDDPDYPMNTTNFYQPVDNIDKLKVRYSEILDTIELSGTVIINGTGLAAGGEIILFSPPVGRRTVKDVYGVAVKEGDVGIQQKPIVVFVKESDGSVNLLNSTAETSVNGERFHFTMRYPLT